MIGMPIAACELLQLFAYHGPNIIAPAPGVHCITRANDDYSARFRQALKQAAQFVELTIAQLDVRATKQRDRWEIEGWLATNEPSLAAAMVLYVVEGLNAEIAGDEEWDPDSPLLELQAQRRAQMLPVPLLQAIAEARARSIPTALLDNKHVLIGQGARGVIISPEQPRVADWGRLGEIEIIAVTGDTAQRAAYVARLAAAAAAEQRGVIALPDATFGEARAALADPVAEVAILGLNTADLAQRGLPFERCQRAIVVAMGDAPPVGVLDEHAWLRAVGLPVLVCRGAAQIDLRDTRLRELLPFAPPNTTPL